jgi:ABC-type uncharacterized transport system permease subunit
MSNLNATGLILAVLISGSFVLSYTTHVIHMRSDAIATGIVRGVRVSVSRKGGLKRWMQQR